MSHCPLTQQIQSYLDGDLPAEKASALRAHLGTCTVCTAELAGYAHLFAALGAMPLSDPGPALTERVLDRVVPSRLRRRWVTAVGWSYTTAAAASTFAFVSWIARPETPVWLAGRFAEAHDRVLQTGLLALHGLTFAWLCLLDGWNILQVVAAWLAPVARALVLLATHPALGATLSAAVVACAVMLWWLRPQGSSVSEEVRRVGVLGF